MRTHREANSTESADIVVFRVGMEGVNKSSKNYSYDLLYMTLVRNLTLRQTL